MPQFEPYPEPEPNHANGTTYCDFPSPVKHAYEIWQCPECHQWWYSGDCLVGRRWDKRFWLTAMLFHPIQYRRIQQAKKEAQ